MHYQIMSKHFKRFVPLLLVLVLLAPVFVQAQNDPIIPPCGQKDTTGKLQPECGFDDLILLIKNIINLLIKLAIPISAAVFAWAGMIMMLNPDNSGKRTEAITMMKKVAIGLAIILSAWLVTNTITRALFAPGYTDIIN